jgi:hypothetical protein
VTERERLDRETLVKQAAALAGAVYVAPALTSTAVAEERACSGQPCKPGKKGKKTCRRKGGKTCACVSGRCAPPCPTPCTRNGPACAPLEECGSRCGAGSGCFLHGGNCGSGPAPGVCVALNDGLCSSYPPCDLSACPAGSCCFSSCCDCLYGYPPLCAPACDGPSRPASRRSPRVADGPRPYV